MEIDEMIEKKRWHKDYRREQVTDYIQKDVAPDMSALYNQYSPVIDGILSDYKLGAGYGLYQEDGHDFMTFRASDCGQACNTYQSKQEGDFIIIQLDAVNKECGSAGYGSAGMSNARYSDKKTEKSKISKSYVIVYYNQWGRENALLSKYQDYVVDFMDYTQPLDDVGFFDSESEAQKVANKVKRKFPAGDYRVVDVNDLSEPLKNLLSEKGLLKAKKTKIEPCIMFNESTGDEVKVTTSEQYDELLDKGYTWLYDCTPSGYGTWADEDVEKSEVKKSYRVIGWDANRDFNDVMEQYNSNYQDERNPVIRFATANDTLEGSALSAKEFSILEDAQKELADWTRGLSASGFTFAIIDDKYNIVKSKTEKSSLDDILNSDDEFKYQMLGRWKSDLDYYFGAGNRNPSNLWAGDFASHIHNIDMVYNSLDVKPDWLNSEMMKEYIRREGYYE